MSRTQELIIACLASNLSTANVQSLDHLRSIMASAAFKRQVEKIALNLTSTESAFRLHCERAAVQVNMWASSFEQYVQPSDLLTHVYRIFESRLAIQWCDLDAVPKHDGLVTCGQCKGLCQRCECAKGNLPCTIFCQCKCNDQRVNGLINPV